MSFPPELIDVLRGGKLLVSVMVVMETLPGVTDVFVARSGYGEPQGRREDLRKSAGKK